MSQKECKEKFISFEDRKRLIINYIKGTERMLGFYNFNIFKTDSIIEKIFPLIWEAKEEIEREDNREYRVNYMIIDILLSAIINLCCFRNYQMPCFSVCEDEIIKIKEELEKEVLFSDDTDALYDNFLNICVKLRKVHKILKDKLKEYTDIKTETD